MSIKPQVLGLIELVENGKMLDAMTQYYAENIAMQENVSPPTVGFAENYARESAFYGSLQALKFTSCSVVVEGDRAVINWVFDYTTADGKQYRMDEIAVQTWRNGKIVHERYIYDTASSGHRARLPNGFARIGGHRIHPERSEGSSDLSAVNEKAPRDAFGVVADKSSRGLEPSMLGNRCPKHPVSLRGGWSRILLLTAATRVRLRLIDHHAMVEVPDPIGNAVHELPDPLHAIVVDVLRLVGHLMVVRVTAGREEDDRNAVARIHVVIAAAIDVLRMPVRVERVVER